MVLRDIATKLCWAKNPILDLERIMPNLLFENVGVRFPILKRDSQRRTLFPQTGFFEALVGVSFTLFPGDRLGVFGANGAGKTSLLRVATKSLPPTTGKIEFAGHITSMLDIGAGMNANATGRENLLFRARLEGYPKREALELCEEIISFAELGEHIDFPLRTYSSGMRMRLAFGLATSLNPDLLVMDEWMSVGDTKFRRTAKRKMASLFRRANIAIIASHSKELLLENTNLFLWLESGKVRYLGKDSSPLHEYFSSS